MMQRRLTFSTALLLTVPPLMWAGNAVEQLAAAVRPDTILVSVMLVKYESVTSLPGGVDRRAGFRSGQDHGYCCFGSVASRSFPE